MELGGPTCAIGACGVSQWPKLVSATPAGSLGAGVDLAQSNLWNVDASEVIFSHTDIYKGRIANLVWELIALPRPQYAEIVMPKSTTLDDGKLAVHTDPQGAKSECLHHTENRPRILWGTAASMNFRDVKTGTQWKE